MNNIFDVIVVGGGGSGLAAAIGAAEEGARVIVIEKNSHLGGSSGMSVGSISSSRTELQRKKGIIDNPDDHFRDLGLFAGQLEMRDNLELRRILVNEVPETVRWLEELGVVFYGPMPEPPHDKPRMHNIIPNSRAYIYYLWKECQRLGVVAVTSANVIEFIKSGDYVSGVRVSTDLGIKEYHTSRAVILTSGDYNNGKDLRSRFTNVPFDVEGINLNEGDGQKLGVLEGSEILNGDIVWGPLLRFLPPKKPSFVTKLPPFRPLMLFLRFALNYFPAGILRPFVMSFVTTFLAPEKSLFQNGAILINLAGERFVDEMDKPAFHVPTENGKKAYIILDEQIAQKFSAWPYFISTAPGIAFAYLNDYRRTRKDIFFKADTIKELAKKISVDPDKLSNTINKWNENFKSTHPNNRSPDCKMIIKGPFYALGPVESRVLITDGGLKTNTFHQVLRTDGSIILGLYAAGASGQGGLLLEGHGHHLAWAFSSGRRAGRFAARTSKDPS